MKISANEFQAKYGLNIDGDFSVGEDVAALPKHLTINGNLILPKNGLKRLPSYLTVNGNLDLGYTSIIAIGAHLTVAGTLTLGNSRLKSLPDFMTVNELKLEGCFIEELPRHLTVHGILNLKYSLIKHIGDYLTVDYHFMTPQCIKELPKHLRVGDGVLRPYTIDTLGGSVLILSDTLVTSLPDDCYIEMLSLERSRVSSFGKKIDVICLYLGNRILEGNPKDLDVCYLYVDNANKDVIDFAISIKPDRKLEISGCTFSFSDNIDLECELVIRDSIISKLPSGIKARLLTLVNTPVDIIPKDIELASYGTLKLEGKAMKCQFEDGLILPGLKLIGASITELSDKISFDELIVMQTPITKLPNELYLKGSLVLNETNLTALPAVLEVGRDMNIGATEYNINIINSRIKVGESLIWPSAPFKSWPDGLLVFKDIQLKYSQIESLPDNFLVNGDLDISNTKIKELPDNLMVVGNLDISNTAIKHLPPSLKVGGKIFAKKTALDAAQRAQMENQNVPTDWLPSWKDGRYIVFPYYGACEVLQDKGNRKLVRQIGQKDNFWIKRASDGKWDSKRISLRSGSSYIFYLGPGMAYS